ncbi:MAG: DUF533 domain-containing protein, partial [Verrucomicrobiota bacterium]
MGSNVLGSLLGGGGGAGGGGLGGAVLGSLLGGRGGGGGLGGAVLGSLLGGGGGGGAGGAAGLLGSLLGGGGAGAGAAPQQGGAAGLLGSLLGGGGGAQATPEPTPEEANTEATLLIRAMCNAAKADGKLDEQEKQNILGRLGEVDQDEIDFIQNELSSPLDVQGFVNSVPKDSAGQVYAFS